MRSKRSKPATVSCTSIRSLAARPGTDVEPIWSIRSARSPSAPRSAAPIVAKSAGQRLLYGTISTCTLHHPSGGQRHTLAAPPRHIRLGQIDRDRRVATIRIGTNLLCEGLGHWRAADHHEDAVAQA